ncbi:hypothetical protein LOK49_LG08G01109 [Camellia lanceoleosa]|uniref:Uncharacterized protein n=1 Tax=Camellia lanceoleosa TaxID=1840588 RepID=A0ACC0GVH1_9ERIC|nr:hypothetical protein LOK49_LG08G01109 [Camellia lanceoleosa]
MSIGRSQDAQEAAPRRAGRSEQPSTRPCRYQRGSDHPLPQCL